MMWMARRAAKVPLVAGGLVRHYALQYTPAPGGYSFLLYHRIDGSLPLELDLDPSTFRRQIRWLAETNRVVSYEEALAGLRLRSPTKEMHYVLTFDDAYLDFFTRVFPLLREYSLPAVLFVTTGFVEDRTPYPMLSNPHAAVEPVTWDMLGAMAESGPVTLGAHTHTHPVLTGLPRQRVEEELAYPLELFQCRLGLRPNHFAYPRGVATPALRTLVAGHYASAVVGGGTQATPDRFDPYRIPRIPIRRSDGWYFFRAKVRGWLDGEEPLYERLRLLAGRSSR